MLILDDIFHTKNDKLKNVNDYIIKNHYRFFTKHMEKLPKNRVKTVNFGC